MNTEQSKLKPREQAALNTFQADQTQTQARDFHSVEELMRFDSAQNPVPPEVAERLNRSLEAEPPRRVPWYKKLFGS